MKPKPTDSTGAVKWQEQPLEWPRSVGQVDRLVAALKVRERRQRRRRIAAAGSLVLIVACSLWSYAKFYPSSAGIPAVALHQYHITAPERRTLPDGSVVELRPGSDVTISFSVDSIGPRRVTLNKGEAHFQVAKNAARPFIVTAGGVDFRAVGTAFSVNLRDQAVEMIVTEGRVAVEQPSVALDVREALTTVPAGNRVVITPTLLGAAPTIIPTSEAEAGSKLAWRVPRLEFNETPLWEVVSLLNQHSGSHISLASAELGRVEISGALRADNVEPLLQMLNTNYGISVVRGSDGQITLRQSN